MKKQFYNAEELAQVLGISKSTAYVHIKQMNKELSEKGYLIISGRIPIAYVHERFFGLKGEGVVS